MIAVRYRSSPDAPWVRVVIDEAKHSIEDVLHTVAQRIGSKLTAEEEKERQARFEEMMRARKANA